MQRELGSFPLTPGVRQKLHSAGFLLVEDIIQVTPEELGRGTFALFVTQFLLILSSRFLLISIRTTQFMKVVIIIVLITTRIYFLFALTRF